MESPEVWFEDVGSGQLVNGKATINLDELFLETVLIDVTHPMQVFIQVQGECNDVYVIPGTTSFEVVEKNNGSSNVKFSYRIMAKRLHFADQRFGCDPLWGPGDTRKYNSDAPVRPVDYNAAVQQREQLKANPPAITYPPGFVMPSAPERGPARQETQPAPASAQSSSTTPPAAGTTPLSDLQNQINQQQQQLNQQQQQIQQQQQLIQQQQSLLLQMQQNTIQAPAGSRPH
jgi:hypothetical protein